MSMLPVAKNGPPEWLSWSNYQPYAIKGTAAGLVVVPLFKGLMTKTEQQKGNAKPQFNYGFTLKEGAKVAPVFALTVAGQTCLQDGLVDYFSSQWGCSKKETKVVLLSSVLAGGASAPLYAVFNGRSNSMGWMQSLYAFNLKQLLAVTVRESSFLLSLKVSTPLTEAMKNHFSDHVGVEVLAAFTSGVVGSFVGHAADTVVTRSQRGSSTWETYKYKSAMTQKWSRYLLDTCQSHTNGSTFVHRKLVSVLQSFHDYGVPALKGRTFFLGLKARAVTLGLFNVLYSQSLKYLDPKEKAK